MGKQVYLVAMEGDNVRLHTSSSLEKFSGNVEELIRVLESYDFEMN